MTGRSRTGWSCLFALLFIFSACTLPDYPADATVIDIDARPVPLNEEDPAQTSLGSLEYIAGLHLTAQIPAFGGLSGLTVSGDGQHLTAVTDKGRWLRARIVRDRNGAIQALAEAEMRPLNDTDGAPIRVGTRWRDSEAIEALPGEEPSEQRYFVSLEGRHRLYLYQPTPEHSDPLRATPIRLPTPPELAKAPLNSGLEAIAVWEGERYLLLSEGFFAGSGYLHAWLMQGDAVTPLKYETTDGFRPTDLARLSEHRLLVLERRFSFIGGFTNRLALIDMRDAPPDGIIRTREIARFAPPYINDNFEGLAVLPRPAGGTSSSGYMVYIVSDDNFNFLQRTLLLQFYWPDRQDQASN